eukprot:508431-Pyramimonas_sp.AAC.1
MATAGDNQPLRCATRKNHSAQREHRAWGCFSMTHPLKRRISACPPVGTCSYEPREDRDQRGLGPAASARDQRAASVDGDSHSQ